MRLQDFRSKYYIILSLLYEGWKIDPHHRIKLSIAPIEKYMSTADMLEILHILEQKEKLITIDSIPTAILHLIPTKYACVTLSYLPSFEDRYKRCASSNEFREFLLLFRGEALPNIPDTFPREYHWVDKRTYEGRCLVHFNTPYAKIAAVFKELESKAPGFVLASKLKELADMPSEPALRSLISQLNKKLIGSGLVVMPHGSHPSAYRLTQTLFPIVSS